MLSTSQWDKREREREREVEGGREMEGEVEERERSSRETRQRRLGRVEDEKLIGRNKDRQREL